MNKIFTTIIINFIVLQAIAQNKPAFKYDQPYGIIDTADLTLKQCDFEKDANAEVLIDKGDETFDEYFDITFIVHKRIKIFNDNGKDAANINIPFIDRITDLKAETINLNGKTIEYTPVDPALFYKQKLESHIKAISFTFPNVKAGSVIELEYKWKIHSEFIPPWDFQGDIPSRFSEIDVTFYGRNPFTLQADVKQPLYRDTTILLNGRDENGGKKYVRSLVNIPSFKTEPYMAQSSNKKQRLVFKYHSDFWFSVYGDLVRDIDFGGQLGYKLTDEAKVLAKMDSIKDKQVRADSIFSLVKNRMTWNNINHWFTIDGVKKAWEKKTGNSTEINLILYHLLTKADIVAYPMTVSTPDYGPVDPEDAQVSEFNKTVVYFPIDSTSYYVLDASDKHSLFNLVPYEVLNTYGFELDPGKFQYKLFKITGIKPARQLVYVKADIKPDGKMSGTADIISDSYNRSASLKLYKDLGEKKYIDYLDNNDNNLKISSLKLDSAEKDSVPLTQHINFNLDLTASDENYIYFNPNLFTSFGSNPFLTTDRVSDIDFTYTNTYIVSGTYTIPAGYKVDALPKNQVIVMEDKSISFKRIVGEQDGYVMVRYVITRKRSYYTQDEYAGLYSFYKEMFRMLDEQIVFKKS